MPEMFLVKADSINQNLFDKLLDLLPDTEKEKILSKRDNQAKINSLIGAFLIRYALKKNYNIHFKEAEITRDNHGKPYLKNHNTIHFSISHSENIVVCAVADKPVGIDIQKINNISENVIKRACSPEECNAIFNSTDPVSSFIYTWTRKEAVLKRKGTGITDKEIKTCLSDENVYSMPFDDFWISCTI